MAVDRATDIFVREDSRESNPQAGILVPRNLLRFGVMHRRYPESGALFSSESSTSLEVESVPRALRSPHNLFRVLYAAENEKRKEQGARVQCQKKR